MDTPPEKAVFFHFRFKFLAITSIAFLLYIILTGASELDQFASSPQFKLVGPFFLLAGCFFLIFRRVPIKCPHCYKLVSTRKDWTCCECGTPQGKERYLVDKCLHCRQVQATASCDHCNKDFKL
ncbi:MAG: hypothetical protein MI863_02845 [Desulfobacterales bacterium]|nr:hypothetical protein [Desulfobacterales bacterium]